MIPQGDSKSFQTLFNTLGQFASFSGCKVNMSKSETIRYGSLGNTDVFSFQDSGLRRQSNTFKTLGINFSLHVNPCPTRYFLLHILSRGHYDPLPGNSLFKTPHS